MNRNEERFDQMMKRRARREDCPLPQGYEQWLDRRLEELPQAGPRRIGRRRLMLLTAAALLLTACTGAAATLALHQRTVHYFDTMEEAAQAATAAAQEAGESAVEVGRLNEVQDYIQLDSPSFQRDLEYYQSSGVVTRHTMGTPEDGWTEMFAGEDEYDRIVEYTADRLSGLAELWPGEELDLSWLEERYETVPGSCRFWQQTPKDWETAKYICLFGEYQGEDGVIFNVKYTYHPFAQVGDDYMLAEGYDLVEQYETRDGVTVQIKMATSVSGKPVFWLDYGYGYVDVNLFGTQLGLEEIKDLADHLDLPALAELVGEG